MRQLIASFNGGEVSPLLVGRQDLPSLGKACRLARNMIPLAVGACVRRPSTLFENTIAGSSHARLIPFVYDSETRYVISIDGDGLLKIYLSDGSLAWSGALSAADVFDPDTVSYSQVNDLIIFACSAFKPQALIRVSDTSWNIHQFDSINYSAGEYNSQIARSMWPAVTDEAVSSFASATGDTDVVESWTIAKTINATSSFIVGGVADATAYAAVTNHGPCPATWRLYIGTTAFTGSIKIEWGDAYDTATWHQLYNLTGISVSNGAAMALLKEWFHGYQFMRISVTRSTGTATLSLRHLGSKTAPSVWHYYRNSGDSLRNVLYSSPPMFSDWASGTNREALQLAYQRVKQQVAVTVGADGTDEFKESSPIFIIGKWELFTIGSWAGDVFVEVKESTGAWRSIRHVTSNKDKNYTIGSEVSGETMRVRVAKTAAAAVSEAAVPRFVLTAVDGVVQQWVQGGLAESADVSDRALKLTDWQPSIDWAQLAQATTAVSRGAFSASQGYPSAVCIHEQRVFFGGTKTRPTTIWASGINDLFNFRRTTLDDSGFMFEVAATEGSPIQSLMSASRGILALTSGDEWLIDGDTTGITPTSISTRRQSRVGSAPIQAISAAGAVLFVQRGNLRFQEYQFAWESQQFQAVDLMELARHLTVSGIRSIAFSQNPEPTIWAVCYDGSLLSCTYNRGQEVIAWAKHTTAGSFESVAVTYGDSSTADDVWLIVNRDGSRLLEKFDVTQWANLYSTGPLYHVDSAVVKSQGSPFTSVTGLSHLDGKTVRRIANGVALTDAVVSGGSVTVPTGTTHAAIGLGFDSELQPMPFDLPLDTGTTQGRKMHVNGLALNLFRTTAGRYSDSATGTLYDLKLSGETTGVVRVAAMGKFHDFTQFYFKSTGALPLNFISVVPTVQPYGD